VDTDENFLNRILALDPDSTTAIYLYGKLLAERGDYFGADMRFKEAIDKDPTYGAAYIASGDMAVQNGTLKHAVEQYKAALDLRPGDIGVLSKLASVYLSLKDLDNAEEILSQIAEKDPENLNLKLIVGQGDLAYERLIMALDERDRLATKTDRTADDETRLKELNDSISSYEESSPPGSLTKRRRTSITSSSALRTRPRLMLAWRMFCFRWEIGMGRSTTTIWPLAVPSKTVASRSWERS